MEKMVNIYVGNLAYEATEEELLDIFARCGKVMEVMLMRDSFSRHGRAYITMEDEQEALKAVEELANKLLHNKALVVMLDPQKTFYPKQA